MAYIPVHLLVTFALLLPEVNQLETLRQPLRDQLPEDLRVVEHPASARRHQLSQDLLRRQGVLRHLGFGSIPDFRRGRFQAIVQITEKGVFSRFGLTRDSRNFAKTSEQTYRVLFVERGRFRREIVRRYGKRRGDRERSPVDPGLGLLQVLNILVIPKVIPYFVLLWMN